MLLHMQELPLNMNSMLQSSGGLWGLLFQIKEINTLRIILDMFNFFISFVCE